MNKRLAARRRRLVARALDVIRTRFDPADPHPFRLVDMTTGYPRTIASMKTRRDAVMAASQLLESGNYGIVFVIDSRPGGNATKHWRPVIQ